MIFNYFKIITAAIFLFLLNSAYAKNNKTVNVLVWWEYLDEPNTSKLIEKECGVTLSYDNYTSYDDMLRRWNSNAEKYDILIFSHTIYNVLKNRITLNNSDLWKNSKNYNPIIRKQYINSHFPHNVVYFAHSLTGFIWNPDIVQLTRDDTVQSAFNKAKTNKVILLDDPVEVNMLLTGAINNNFNDPNNKISLENLKKLTLEARIYISNEINKIYGQKDFAFAYQWSDLAFVTDKNIQKYRFLINEHLSYVSSDLLAQITDSKPTACVANILAGKQFLSELQKRTRYFSPYGNIDTVPEGAFKEAYKKFLSTLPRLYWLEPPSADKYNKLNREWDRVKYELTQNRE